MAGFIEFYRLGTVIENRLGLAPNPIPHPKHVLRLSAFSNADEEFSFLVTNPPLYL